MAAMTGVDRSSAVQAVVDQFGPSDLTKIAADFDPATQAAWASVQSITTEYVLGPGNTKTLAQEPAAAAAADPITYVKRGDPPFALFHGSDDHIVSPSQTLLLLDALRAKGVDSTRYVVEGANHGGLTVILGDTPANVRADQMWTTRKVMGDILGFLRHHIGRLPLRTPLKGQRKTARQREKNAAGGPCPPGTRRHRVKGFPATVACVRSSPTARQGRRRRCHLRLRRPAMPERGSWNMGALVGTMIVNGASRAAAFSLGRAIERGVLSRETAKFSECPVEVVGDTLAEQPPERLVAGGGRTADSVGVGLDARSHHVEELRFGCRRAVCTQEPAEQAGLATKSVNPSVATTCRACRGTQLKAAKARSHSGVAGPAKSQSKNPARVP